MVSAVFFYATVDDTAELMKYLRFGADLSLHPWPLVEDPPVQYSLDQAMKAGHVMAQSSKQGPPVVLRDNDPALRSGDRAAVFNALNRPRSKASGLLHDSNRSPVLLWSPGETAGNKLCVSSIGSQADAMRSVSIDYERWVNRTMSWIRRHGTAVWGLGKSSVRPDLDIQLEFVNTVYALPGALRYLEVGGSGR